MDDLPDKPPEVIIPKPTSANVFLSFDPLELARQLTILEFELFSSISSRELLDKYWKVNGKVKTPNISAYEKWKRGLYDLLVAELTAYTNEKLQLQAFELMLSTAEVIKSQN